MRSTSMRRLVALSVLIAAVVIASQVVLNPGELPQKPDSAPDPFADFTVKREDDALTFVRGSQELVPEEAFGAYFMNIETGIVEGWYDPLGQMHPGLASDDNRLVPFYRSNTVVQAF
jgi:hypothetical protein